MTEPFPRYTGAELEELLVKRLASPSQMAYVVSTVTVGWWNVGTKFDILREAHRRFTLKIVVDTDKLRWGGREFTFHVRGEAWQCAMFTEMIAKYCV